MLSASNRLAGPRWKTPKLFCISSFLCGYESDFSHGSISHLLNTKHITTTAVKLPVSWICLPYSMLILKTRSLVTEASIEADQALDEISLELQKGPASIKDLCNYHINELCKKGELGAAARLLQLIRDKHTINSLPAYNLLLAAAYERNDSQVAFLVFKDMLLNHLQMNATTFFNFAKAISQSNDLTLVLSVVDEISQLGYTASATVIIINRIIYALAECKDVHNAMLVFDHMKSFKIKPDLVTYNTVLGILGKAGRIDEMLDLFALMKKLDINPDIFSYNTLLHSLRRVGRFDLCVLLIEEMGTVGLQPDLLTYTALIESFFKSGNIEESLRLFQHMKSVDVRPSIYIYRSLVNHLKKLGNYELALKFMEEMNERGEDLIGPKDIKPKRR